MENKCIFKFSPRKKKLKINLTKKVFKTKGRHQQESIFAKQDKKNDALYYPYNFGASCSMKWATFDSNNQQQQQQQQNPRQTIETQGEEKENIGKARRTAL